MIAVATALAPRVAAATHEERVQMSLEAETVDGLPPPEPAFVVHSCFWWVQPRWTGGSWRDGQELEGLCRWSADRVHGRAGYLLALLVWCALLTQPGLVERLAVSHCPIEFAKLGHEEYQNDAMIAESEPPEEQVSPMARPAQARVVAGSSVRASLSATAASPRSAGDGAALRWELSDGTWVDLLASAPFTAETIDELMEYLRVYEKVLKKRTATVQWAPVATPLQSPVEAPAASSVGLLPEPSDVSSPSAPVPPRPPRQFS